jgi:hypothetical protein
VRKLGHIRLCAWGGEDQLVNGLLQAAVDKSHICRQAGEVSCRSDRNIREQRAQHSEEGSQERANQVQDNNQVDYHSVMDPLSYNHPHLCQDEQQEVDSHDSHGEVEMAVASSHVQAVDSHSQHSVDPLVVDI